VATTNVGSAQDLVCDGKTGVLADSPDPEVLAAALGRIASLRPEREQMRAAAREQVKAVDIDTAAAELEALIGRLNAR
jgi:glycosyltransferase involved in cell wall biosynthesis